MRLISPRIRKIIDTDPYYRRCARHQEGSCKGRITMEHALTFAGRQMDEAWAIIPLCAWHHAVDGYQDGGDLQKEKNVWVALNRATDDELQAISKAVDYKRMRDNLNMKYDNI